MSLPWLQGNNRFLIYNHWARNSNVNNFLALGIIKLEPLSRENGWLMLIL
jgi:hypothetical protein